MNADVAWFVDRLHAELPVRLHSRDTAENGNPEMAYAFLAYVTDGENGRWQTVHREDTDYCNHPTLDRPGHCPTCDDTGLRIVTRKVLRHPMSAALARLARQPVPKGRPPLDRVLWALAVHDGDAGAAIEALATQFAYMWNPTKARRWVSHALYQVRAIYREDVTARELRDTSISQQIAEAA